MVFARPTFAPTRLSVKDYGAIGDAKARDTAAINAAIEACNIAGGGTVFFPPGTYKVASVRLRSNVRLLLDDRAVIVGAKDGYEQSPQNPFEKYQDVAHSYFRNSIIFGEEIENVAIEGGTINGGEAVTSETVAGEGDKVICVRSGRNLSFTNIRHHGRAHFTFLLNDCEQVALNKITIKKTRDAVNLVNCRDVAISQCKFTGCSDDVVAIKSDFALGRDLSCRNIYVWDCEFETTASALQFGSESIGDMRDVYFWDIRITGAARAGISITTNDGGTIENVHYKNISMKKVANPIFLLVTKRLRTPHANAAPGTIRNVTFDKIVATDVVGLPDNPDHASTLSGLPASHIRNLFFNDVRITYQGDKPASEASASPGYGSSYHPRAMGPRPASGFYVRHVTDAVFRDVTIGYKQQNNKPPLVFLDAHRVLIEGLTVPKPVDVDAIRLHKVTDFSLRNSRGFEDVNHAEIDMPMPFRLTSATNLKWAAPAAIVVVVWHYVRRRRVGKMTQQPESFYKTDEEADDLPSSGHA